MSTKSEPFSTPASLGRLIKADNAKGNRGPQLYVCDVKGELWATETHWAVKVDLGNRLDRITALLAHYNLTPEVGRYEVNGTVNRADGDAPNLGHIVEPLRSECCVVLTPHLVADRQAFVDLPGGLVAVFDRLGGHQVAVRADYLDLAAPGWRDGDDNVVLYQQDNRPQGVVGVAVRGPSTWSTKANTYERVEHPGSVSEAVVMPYRI